MENLLFFQCLGALYFLTITDNLHFYAQKAYFHPLLLICFFFLAFLFVPFCTFVYLFVSVFFLFLFLFYYIYSVCLILYFHLFVCLYAVVSLLFYYLPFYLVICFFAFCMLPCLSRISLIG